MATQDSTRRSTIAVIGASVDRSKYGNKCVRAYDQAGWEVYPVNLRATEIEGLRCYARLAEISVGLDRISVYLPPSISLEVLGEISTKSAGVTLFNPGSADEAVVDRARELDIEFKVACSIVDIGLSPSQFP